ncbi:ABC transporter permease subunit [Actinophytocola sp. S1-96]|uniref:ABC transporter permease subunit n=2 Tax=Actinophytocola gossypii TaxID=2812003 RepID=A0ABT2JHW9_9PSEU|nr:ABC transporter permease subunit [Actinophytocola gossypii]
MSDVRTTTRATAPLGRVLRSELRFILRRPRTLVALAALAFTPVIAGISVAIAAGSMSGGRRDDIAGIAMLVADNGLILPIFVLLLAMPMMLPLCGAMWSADALAGEASTGGLRNLLLAPVSRPRLLAVKAFGVAAVSLLAVTIMAVTAILAGIVLLGGEGMLTLSGSTMSVPASLGRIALLTLLVTIQVWAVAAIALAISSTTDHPLIVLAATTGGIVLFTVLGGIDTLSWLHPVLLTDGWLDMADVVRDPLPADGLVENAFRATCYILIGYSLALARLTTRDG